MAARLHPIKPVKYDQIDVNSNNYLFLKVDGKVRVYSIVEGASADPQPHWYLLYADQLGRLSEELSLRISRLSEVDGALTISTADAKVVTELRYEYAINLMHKLGGSLTRVGLDFAA